MRGGEIRWSARGRGFAYRRKRTGARDGLKIDRPGVVGRSELTRFRVPLDLAPLENDGTSVPGTATVAVPASTRVGAAVVRELPAKLQQATMADEIGSTLAVVNPGS